MTDDYARSYEFANLTSDLPKPKLALNGAGGVGAAEVARALA